MSKRWLAETSVGIVPHTTNIPHTLQPINSWGKLKYNVSGSKRRDLALKIRKSWCDLGDLTDDEEYTIHHQSPMCSMCGCFVECENLTTDHIIPLTAAYFRGKYFNNILHTKRNIQALCKPCNSKKSDHIPISIKKFKIIPPEQVPVTPPIFPRQVRHSAVTIKNNTIWAQPLYRVGHDIGIFVPRAVLLFFGADPDFKQSPRVLLTCAYSKFRGNHIVLTLDKDEDLAQFQKAVDESKSRLGKEKKK